MIQTTSSTITFLDTLSGELSNVSGSVGSNARPHSGQRSSVKPFNE